MALNGQNMGLVLILIIVTITIIIGEKYEVKAQSGCTSVMISLSPCLNYVTGKSSTPSTSCCSQLGTVVLSQPQCLCSVMNGGGSLGISINQTLALALPAACNVKTPPVSRCNGGASESDSTPPLSSPVDSTSGDTTSKETPAAQNPRVSSNPTSSSGTNRAKVIDTPDESTTTSKVMNLHFRTLFIATCALTTVLIF